MKRLVLLGEGQGEVDGLPILTRKVLADRAAQSLLFADKDVVRAHNAVGLVKMNKLSNQIDYAEWLRYLKIAARRSDLAGVVAVFDGDAKHFPAGSKAPFCAATAAKQMALAARSEGAGIHFSLAIVFACVEYESWIIAGGECLRGQKLDGDRLALPPDIQLPMDNPELHGKSWLIKNCPGYRPTRDQGALTKLLDINVLRSKQVRSFRRFERAIDLIIESANSGQHVCSPA
jgi:hypothetical protein